MMIKGPVMFWEQAVTSVILFTGAFLTSTLVVWQFCGKVRVQFDKQTLQIFNTRIPFKRRVQIPYRLVSRIIYAKDRNSVWGVTSGNIILHYYGGSRKFGQDLSEEEATLIIRQIKERIKSIGNTTSEFPKHNTNTAREPKR